MAKNAKQNEMIRMLMGLFGGPASIPAQVMKGAHDNIDALISNNENKDFFELQNASMMGNVGMMGGMGAIPYPKMMPQPEEPGMGMAIPYPKMMPNEQAFQQAIQRLQLEQSRRDPRVESILNSHIRNLFKHNK